MYCTLTVTEKDFKDFDKIHRQYRDAFKGTSINIPEVIRVRHINNGVPVLATFKGNTNGLIDVHFEIEGAMLRTSAVIGGFDMIPQVSNNLPIFDMRVQLVSPKKGMFKVVTPPQNKMFADWLRFPYSGYVPCLSLDWLNSKSNPTVLIYIMSLHFFATRVCGFVPFALDFSKGANGSMDAQFSKHFIELASAGLEKQIKEEREKHRFDGWDVVRLTWDQLEKVSSIVAETGKIDSMDILPLNKFAVVVQDPDRIGMIAKYINMGRNELSCNVALTDMDGDVEFVYEVQRIENPLIGEAKLVYTFASDDADNLSKKDNALFRSCGNGKNTVESLWDIFINVSSFMLNYKDETMDVEERECKQQSEGKHHHHSHRNSVRLFKSYTLKKGWKTKANRKKAEIHCLAWGVRGHYRHYRNGKVIFVNAYVKGKERAKYAGKDYLLLPQAE